MKSLTQVLLESKNDSSLITLFNDYLLEVGFKSTEPCETYSVEGCQVVYSILKDYKTIKPYYEKLSSLFDKKLQNLDLEVHNAEDKDSPSNPIYFFSHDYYEGGVVINNDTLPVFSLSLLTNSEFLPGGMEHIGNKYKSEEVICILFNKKSRMYKSIVNTLKR